ncbi:MAG: SdiA-regulated domain-containing protein [bacterium]
MRARAFLTMLWKVPFLFFLGCQAHAEDPSKPLPSPSPASEIRSYDFSDKSVQVFDLPRDLAEASGLTFTADGRLFSHTDEAGMIFEIDPKTGKELRRFYLGRPMLRGDFEGVAARQDTLFLTNSSGTIFRFRAGENGQPVKYDMFKTALSAKNDVEGLAYDAATNCLLLACKGDAGTGRSDQKAIYSFSLKTYKLEPKPRFLLPLAEILAQTQRKEFNPSGLERHPVTGNFFVLANNGLAMIEIDPQGKIMGVSTLPKSLHKQPEGLAIATDGTVFIANEGQGKTAKLVMYRLRK